MRFTAGIELKGKPDHLAVGEEMHALPLSKSRLNIPKPVPSRSTVFLRSRTSRMAFSSPEEAKPATSGHRASGTLLTIDPAFSHNLKPPPLGGGAFTAKGPSPRAPHAAARSRTPSARG